MSPQTKTLTADSLSGSGLSAASLTGVALPEVVAGDGAILLEDGTSFLLTEAGDKILLE